MNTNTHFVSKIPNLRENSKGDGRSPEECRERVIDVLEAEWLKKNDKMRKSLEGSSTSLNRSQPRLNYNKSGRDIKTPS
jgi:hypothetical protein